MKERLETSDKIFLTAVKTTALILVATALVHNKVDEVLEARKTRRNLAKKRIEL